MPYGEPPRAGAGTRAPPVPSTPPAPTPTDADAAPEAAGAGQAETSRDSFARDQDSGFPSSARVVSDAAREADAPVVNPFRTHSSRRPPPAHRAPNTGIAYAASDDRCHGSLQVPEDAPIHDSPLGVKMRLREATVMLTPDGDPIRVRAGIRCIARPDPSHEGNMLVEAYDKPGHRLGASAASPTRRLIATGSVANAALSPRGRSRPQRPGAWTLFPDGSPAPRDVQQGTLGDCALLSALISATHQDPRHITDAMRDNGDGTLTVRLYAWVAGDNERLNRLVPRYYRVEKTAGGHISPFRTQARGAPWVRAMESALALHARYLTQATEGRTPELTAIQSADQGRTAAALLEALTGKPHRAFRELEAGSSAQAYKPLWEDRARVWHLPTERVLEAKGGDFPLAMAFSAHAMLHGWRWTEATPADLASMTSDSLSGTVQVDLRRWHKTAEDFIERTVEMIPKFRDDYVRRDATKSVQDTRAILARMASCMPGDDQPDTVEVDLSRAWEHLREDPSFRIREAGPVGSGIYTPAQNGFFDELRAILADGHPVTAGTPASPTRTGLAGQHGYAILAVEEADGVKFVHVRNPWGAYGRAYTKLGGHWLPRPTSAGTFRMEYSDFMRCFRDISLPV